MKRIFISIGMLMLVALAGGCASQHMAMVGHEKALSYAPGANESTVVFLRPSSLGGAIQSSVFDVTAPESQLVGIVSAQKKVAYKTSPGEHLFMVIGESADFMKAVLEAGKTYYALVMPRMGIWKARFSLKPVHRDELPFNSEELAANQFAKWERDCEYAENTESSYAWARENTEDIRDKRTSYLLKWLAKPEAQRPVINKEDGR